MIRLCLYWAAKTLSPLESALTENATLSPLESALTKNTRGVGAISFPTRQDDAVRTGAHYEIENTDGRTHRIGTGSSAAARKPFFPAHPFSGTDVPNGSHIADSAFLL